MTLVELAHFMDEFGMDPHHTQILYLPRLSKTPDDYGRFPEVQSVVPAVLKNVETGKMAVAIVPKSEFMEMEHYNPQDKVN